MSDSGDDKTERVLRRAMNGDVQARAELLNLHRDRLKRMVAIRLDRRLAARVDASDIVQEAMRDAFERLSEYFADPQIAFYPWLRRIAWDRLMDVYRQHIAAEKRSVLKERAWIPDLSEESVMELAQSLVTNSQNPGQQALRGEMEDRMLRALLDLKPQDREILVLRYMEQLDVAEIASVLGISQTAVTSRHLRAVQRLRRLVGDVSAEELG
ncbi:MAG TPA: sigma-70 family RNA polymerase sigma factor [Lacipirellulaceae bacterium]|nr:sigma-70 family RNA polymerase sigma factor [Lacipirellulaceae bacterium]